MPERDALLSHAACLEALADLGHTRLSLYARRNRGTGPRCVRRRGRLLYRWGDVLDWAETLTGTSRIALDNGTALGSWLRRHRESASGLAARLEISPYAIYKLVGHRNATTRHRHGLRLTSDILELVALETGIGVGQLAEDAIKAAQRAESGEAAAVRSA